MGPFADDGLIKRLRITPSLVWRGMPSFALLRDTHQSMTTLYIAIPAMILYFAAGIKLGLRLSKGTQNPGAKRPLLALGLVAAALHAAILYLGFFNALSLLSWLIAVLVLLAALTQPLENLGIAVLPLAAIALLLEQIFPSAHLVSGEAAIALRLHIAISIFAYSLFSIAAVQAILLAIQDRHLHGKRPGGYIRALPPLETMETLLFQLIGIGFILQSLSLLSGILYLEDMFAQHLVHKTVFSIIAWVIFAILLLGRWRSGWRGRVAIRWTLGGFTALLLAYLGSKWVLEIVLNR